MDRTQGLLLKGGVLQSQIKCTYFSELTLQLMAVVLCMTSIPKIGKQSFLSIAVSGCRSRLVGTFAHVATGASQNRQLVLSVRNPRSRRQA